MIIPPNRQAIAAAAPPPFPPAGGVSETTPRVSLPDWVNKGRVPCLDGLRALAIALVIDSHINERRHAGHLGVTLFFVISGFLITLLMLREQNRTGGISLKDFYLRRTLRIMPALLFYLLVVGILQWFGITHVLLRYWIGALTYTMCYVNNGSAPMGGVWDVGHVWSLSVEEHFYLLWPLLFVFLKPAKAFQVLVIYLLLVPFLRALTYTFIQSTVNVDFASITEMGSIGMGCVAAYFAHGRILPRLGERLQRSPHLLFFIGGILVVAVTLLGSTKFQNTLLKKDGLFEKTVGDPVGALGFAMLLLWMVYLPGSSVVSRVLNWRPLVFVGTLSYSLYLWQQLFTGDGSLAHRSGVWDNKFLTVALLTACALVSYYAVEVPFLRLKERRRQPSPAPLSAASP